MAIDPDAIVVSSLEEGEPLVDNVGVPGRIPVLDVAEGRGDLEVWLEFWGAR